jgi:vacuolar-type H+-ATPase subunit C/Vma6
MTMRQMTDNLEFVAALLHGRRSHMAEGERLQALCRARTLADLAREVPAGRAAQSATEIELQLVQGLAQEAADVARHLTGPVAGVLQWLAGRFQVENLKLLVRRLMTDAPLERLTPHLLALPPGLQLDLGALAKAESLGALLRLIPGGPLRRSLAQAVDFYHEQPRSFFFEAALDRGYFGELLLRTDALPAEDREWVRPIVVQEVDIFHLMLVTRGKLLYGLEPESLLPLHLSGTRISRDHLAAMLTETEIQAVASRALGHVVDELPGRTDESRQDSDAAGPGRLERLAWTRFWRLANRAFRRSHMGRATAVAYIELRRVEVANLITVCEGVRAGLSAETLYARLVPLHATEATHV